MAGNKVCEFVDSHYRHYYHNKRAIEVALLLVFICYTALVILSELKKGTAVFSRH